MGLRPHLSARGKSHIFSRVATVTWGTFSSYGGDGHSELVFVHRRPDSCLVMRETPGSSKRLGRALRTLLQMRWETEHPFPVATVILRFLSTFKKSQSSSPFKALSSAWLSRYQREVRPPVQMRRGCSAFYRVSTGDLDIPSSCLMKEQPAFKPLQ